MGVLLDINLNGDKIWGENPPPTIVHWEQFTISTLIGGMSSGKPSIALIARDGDTGYVAETSLVNLLVAADLFNLAHGDPRHDDWTQPEIDEIRENLDRWYRESMKGLDLFEAALQDKP